jgi:hypothetical protein
VSLFSNESRSELIDASNFAELRLTLISYPAVKTPTNATTAAIPLAVFVALIRPKKLIAGAVPLSATAPASAVLVTTVASPDGAATPAWLASASASAAVVDVTPRRANRGRNRSSARVTRFRAASSVKERAAPMSANEQLLK